MTKKPMIVTVVLALSTFLNIGFAQPRLTQAQEKTERTCAFAFSAAIQQGPDTGTSLTGELDIKLDKDGGLTGSFIPTTGTTLDVAGQVTGRAINLAIQMDKMTDKSPGSFIYGTGTAWNNISSSKDCGATLGGTFAGYKGSDAGVWDGIYCDLAAQYFGTGSTGKCGGALKSG